MKKIILSLFTLGFMTVNAQDVKVGTGDHIIKAGPMIGIPVGDVSDTSSFTLGADVRYQYLTKSSFGLGLATGYTHYFGKDYSNGTVEYKAEDHGVIPLAAMARYYHKNFFIGTDIGYGFVTNTAEGADTGGFYMMPQVGYHADKYNVFAFYQNLNVDNSNIATVGIGASINLTN